MEGRFKVACSCCSVFENVKPNKRLCCDIFFEDCEDCETNDADDQWSQNSPGVPRVGHAAPCNWNQEARSGSDENDRSNPVHSPEFVRKRANLERQDQGERYKN